MNIIKKLKKAKRQKFLVNWLCNCIYLKFSDVFRERIDSCPLGTVCIYPKDLSIESDSFIKSYIENNEDLPVSYCMELATRKFHHRIEALYNCTCMVSKDVIYVSYNPYTRGFIDAHSKIEHGVERILKGETDYIDLSGYKLFEPYRVNAVEYAHSLLPNLIQKLYRPVDLFYYVTKYDMCGERLYLKTSYQDVKHNLVKDLKFLTEEV